MINSLWRYTRYFSSTIFLKKERVLLWRNFKDYYFTESYLSENYSPTEKLGAMNKAANWLLTNQKFQADHGFSTYYIVDGHTGSYPETSGYIIDSLFDYAMMVSQEEKVNSPLFSCADWLVSIQKPSGGWQAGYVEANKPEVVFNTGQVIRGLLKAYHISKEIRYLESCIKAGDWLCKIQENDGSWQTQASMNAKRTYDSYVAAALVDLFIVTGHQKYKTAAINNINWILHSQQQTNGWFSNCDNTVIYNHNPILHTIAYTIDGILDVGLKLKDVKYIEAARKSADQLLNIFEKKKIFNGRYDKNWKGTQYTICTGCAQMSIIWSKLFQQTKDDRYRKAVERMNDQLISIQRMTHGMGKKTEGALQGSFPIWGKYEPFAFPNWATKYLLDAIMLELKNGGKW